MFLNFVKKFLHPLRAINDLLINNEFKRFTENPKNPLNKHGLRCFSQCDEDGITLEIIKRINIDKGVFFEIGSDNGTQNNTLILAALKWKGVWVDIKELIFDHKKSKRLIFIKEFVTEENVKSIILKGLNQIGAKSIDCLSIDLDGPDFFIVKKILSEKIFPKFFIVEINQRIPPPVELVPNKKNSYDKNDTASLASFNKLFKEHNYTLICCSSIMGHNAFFIKNEFLEHFKEVPNKIEDIYVKPNYRSFSVNYETGTTKKMLENIFFD